MSINPPANIPAAPSAKASFGGSYLNPPISLELGEGGLDTVNVACLVNNGQIELIPYGTISPEPRGVSLADKHLLSTFTSRLMPTKSETWAEIRKMHQEVRSFTLD